MRKEIRTVDEKRKIVQITTTDERWYARFVSDPVSGLPTFKFYPSVTWKISVFPKLGLMKLRDEVGAEESELMKRLGGERGSKVHDACSRIIEGKEVRVDSKFVNPNTQVEEELTADEIRYVMSFVEWVKKAKPEFLVWDQSLYSDQYYFGGTLDFIARIGGELYLVDIKTSKVVSTPEYMQVSAYKAAIANGENDLGIALPENMKLAILQLGTQPLKSNPEEFRFREVEDCLDLFVATGKVWEDVYENQIKDGRGYSQKDYPIVLSPAEEEDVVIVPDDVDTTVPMDIPPAPKKKSKKESLDEIAQGIKDRS